MTTRSDPERSTATQPLHVSLLGALRITIGDRPISLRGSKGAGILATMAVEASQPGTRISSERLRDTIWPGTDPDTSKPRLETAINSLRKTIGYEYFSHGTPYYFLAATRVVVDVHEFLSGARRLVAVGIGAAQVDAANQLLELWRGEPAPEFTECDWHRDLSAQLTEARTALELALAAYHDSIGEHAEAARHLRSVLRRNETHQGACVQLMRSLYLDNRTNDAIDVYQQMVGLLLDEYGLDPVPELEQTYVAILNNNVDRPEIVPQSTPVKVTCWLSEISSDQPLLGRDDERSLLTDFFAQPPTPAQPRIALVTGASGIGKSRLVKELAERGAIAPSPNDALLFGRVSPVDSSPFQLIGDVIRRIHRSRPDVFESLSPIGKGLAANLLPEMFPPSTNGLTVTDGDFGVPSEPMIEIFAGEHDVPRQTAVQAHSLAHELFDRIRGDGGRVVLIIDDAHHLPPDTFSVLNFLLTVAGFSMLDVICTLRPTEEGHEDELLRLARTMEIHQTARVVQLEPLQPVDTIALASECAHGRWDSAVPKADLPELTGGNPLLITYVTRAILDDRSLTFDSPALGPTSTSRSGPSGAGEIGNDSPTPQHGFDDVRSPPALDRALQHLVDQVGDESQHFLTAACVWPSAFSATLVGRVANQLPSDGHHSGPNGSVEQAVDRLIALRLLREAASANGALTFSHELLRRRLYAQLPGPTRERIHYLTATALEAAAEKGHSIEPSQVAHHLRLSGDLCEPERVADALLASADVARRGWSRRTEIAEIERALPYLESPRLLAKRAEALTNLGEAEARLHGMEASITHLREAAEAARTLGDWNLFARIALLFGGSIPLGDYYGSESSQLVAEALEHLSDGPTHVRALLLARGAQLGFWDVPASTRRHQCEQAERLVASSGLMTRAAIALHSFWALDGSTDMDEQWTRLAIVQQAAEELNDRNLMMNAAKCQIHLHLGYGNLEAADQAARTLAAHAVRSEDLEFRRLSVQYDAMREMSRGNFDLGYRFARQVTELLTTMGRRERAGFVKVAQDLSARAVKGTVGVCAPRFRRLATEDGPVSAWACAAWAESELGPSRAADELLRGVWRRWDSHVRTPERWLTVVATLSAAIRLQNDEMVERAAIKLEREEQAVCRIASLAFYGLATFHLGRAAKFRGETDLAREYFRQSVDRSFRIGTKPWAIWAAAELASVGGELPPELPTADAILEGARAFGLVQVANLMAVDEDNPIRSTTRPSRPGAPRS